MNNNIEQQRIEMTGDAPLRGSAQAHDSVINRTLLRVSLTLGCLTAQFLGISDSPHQGHLLLDLAPGRGVQAQLLARVLS